MYYLDKLPGMRIFLNKPFSFQHKNLKDKNIYFLCTKTKTESVNIINSKIISPLWNNSYFVDKQIKINYPGKKIILDQKNEYVDTTSQCPHITKTYNLLKQYETVNSHIFYDLYYYNQLIFDDNSFPFSKKILLFESMLSSVLNYTNHTKDKIEVLDKYKKYVILSLEKTLNIEEEIKTKKLTNPISILYYLVYINEERFKEKFQEVEFLILDTISNSYFKFDSESITKKTLPRFFNLVKMIDKKEFTEIDQTDLPEYSDTTDSTPEQSKEEIVKGIEKERSKETKMKVSVASGKVVNKVKMLLNIDEKTKGLTGEEVNLTNKLTEIASKVEEEKGIKNEEDLEKEVLQNEEFVNYLDSLKNEKITAARNNITSKREEILKENQRKIKVDTHKGVKTLDEVMSDFNDKTITTNKITHLDLRNKELSESTITDLEENYIKKQDQKDKMKILQFFSKEDRENKLYIRKIEKTNTSTSFDKKETWKIEFEDEKRVRHNITLDVPILVDNKYFYLNDSKKFFKKQLIMLPVCKTDEDTVVLTTNYNKAFMRRFGKKISPKLERIKKFISVNKGKDVDYQIGNNIINNREFLTNIDYDEFSSNYNTINVGKNIVFYFNQKKFREHLIEKNILSVKEVESLPDGKLPIGLVNDKKLLYLNTEKNNVTVDGKEEDFDMVDLIMNKCIESNPKMENVLKDTGVGKKYMYSRSSILYEQIPTMLLLSYLVGISEVLNRAKIKHEFSDKRRVLSLEEKHRLGVLEFKDGYLYYDQFPFGNSLLMNWMSTVVTKENDYADFDKKDVYIDIMYDMYNSRTISKGISNFMELFIDPITEDVLEDMNLPTNVVDLFIYANNLLSDNTYTNENNMNLYRIRSTEVINAYLYKVLANAYRTYKDSQNTSSPQKMSVPRDALIKELNQCVTLNDYSVLSPILELERQNSVTFQGLSGLNVTEAFTLDKRSYDQSMLGIVALSTPFDSSVGVTREITYNPNILSTRGYLKAGNSTFEGLNSANVMSFAELCTPLSADHDDAMRTAMMTAQSKHQIPIEKTDKLLVGYGAEKTLPYLLSNDFVFKAKDDGKVVTYSPENKILVLEYTSGEMKGKKDVVDLGESLGKNSGGGFFITNNKVSDLKIGDKFKKNDILAKNEKYFKGGRSDTEYTIGNLSKVCIHSGYYTFEDSCLVTDKFGKEMTSYITMMKKVILGVNSNVDYIVKRGQHVETGEPLMKYDQSFTDKESNDFLEKITPEFKDKISEYTKNMPKCKHTGDIVDIRIYWTTDESKFSKSLQKIIKDYKKEVNSKKIFIEKHMGKDNHGEIILRAQEMIDDPSGAGRVKNEPIGEGMLIEFYIRYKDILGVGDKVASYSAVKSIVGEVVPDHLAPYSDYRKDEPIDCMVGPTSLASRMVNSIYLTMWANKVLIELKRKIGDIISK